MRLILFGLLLLLASCADPNDKTPSVAGDLAIILIQVLH